jgi:hypothetical protein
MISKNGAAIVVMFFSWLGFEIAETEIQEFLAAPAQIIAFLVMLWNQVDRKDVKWGLWKTPERD